MSDIEYHLRQVEIARDPTHPRWDLPAIPSECRSILDIGCGCGPALIAGDFAPGTLLCGVDIDEAALRLGKSLDGRIHFIKASGMSPPCADSSFDMIMSRVALPYMNMRPALASFYRILRPGGSLWLSLQTAGLVFADLARHLRSFHARAALYRSYVLANGVVLHATGRTLPFPSKPLRYESFQTRSGIRRALETAGFRECRVEVAGPRFTVAARKPSEEPDQGLGA